MKRDKEDRPAFSKVSVVVGVGMGQEIVHFIGTMAR
jgi:hypothetical protein